MTRKPLETVALALFTITLALPWSDAAAAQTNLTVAGGLNRATVTAETEGLSLTPESVNRLAIGASVEVPMSERFGLHLGAGYSQKGFALDALGASVTTEIDYLEITALAGVPFSISESASVHLLAGPALAFKVSCGVSASFLGEEIDEDCGDDGPKAMDLGLVSGVRLEYGLSEKMGISVGTLYNLGLLNMDGSDSGETLKSRVISLQAGIVYSIG
ncbi:MAG: porin family protein [Gemmatimonadetes bacterium]|nr:porin family protein [Gemmatimonadota bacterium]